MKFPASAGAILVISSIALVACGSSGSGAVRHVEETLFLCQALRSPDADQGDGEVRFWLNAARAEASQKLWNRAGKRAVAAALAKTRTEEELECLSHLQDEIHARQVTGW